MSRRKRARGKFRQLVRDFDQRFDQAKIWMVLRRLRAEIKWWAFVVRGSGVFAWWHAADADDSAGISDVPPGRRRTVGKQGPQRGPDIKRAEVWGPPGAGQ